MVSVRIGLADGLLRSLEMSGHARNGGKGDAGACAALSLLARSAADSLRRLDGVGIDGGGETPGTLAFRLEYGTGCPQDRVRGITDMTVNGMLSVEREYPRLCTVSIANDDA